MDHVLVFMMAVTVKFSSNYIPECHFEISPISCPLMMMSGGLIFSQIPVPVPNLSTEHSRVDRWLWRDQPKLTFFSFLRQAETLRMKIFLLKYLSRQQKSESKKPQRASGARQCGELLCKPISCTFSCKSFIILQQTNKTFTSFANYLFLPFPRHSDSFTGAAPLKSRNLCSVCMQ